MHRTSGSARLRTEEWEDLIRNMIFKNMAAMKIQVLTGW